jgi:hypothetical protein
VLASSAFFRGLIAERWTEDEADVSGGGEVGERRVLEVELPAGVSGSFFERLLRSFYGGPQLTRLQLIAAQADLAALQQMAPTIATAFDAAAAATTTDDATDDDAIDTAGDVVDDTAPTDESEPTTATMPTPRASWSRKLRAWLRPRGEAADHPPTETESLPQQQQRHGRPQSPPPQDHQPLPPQDHHPLPPLVAWALVSAPLRRRRRRGRGGAAEAAEEEDKDGGGGGGDEGRRGSGARPAGGAHADDGGQPALLRRRLCGRRTHHPRPQSRPGTTPTPNSPFARACRVVSCRWSCRVVGRVVG